MASHVTNLPHVRPAKQVDLDKMKAEESKVMRNETAPEQPKPEDADAERKPTKRLGTSRRDGTVDGRDRDAVNADINESGNTTPTDDTGTNPVKVEGEGEESEEESESESGPSNVAVRTSATDGTSNDNTGRSNNASNSGKKSSGPRAVGRKASKSSGDSGVPEGSAE